MTILSAALPLNSFSFTLAIRARRAMRNLSSLLQRDGYRPERHYMRGGRTEGSRTLARTRLIAGE